MNNSIKVNKCITMEQPFDYNKFIHPSIWTIDMFIKSNILSSINSIMIIQNPNNLFTITLINIYTHKFHQDITPNKSKTTIKMFDIQHN